MANRGRRFTFPKDRQPKNDDQKKILCDICDRPNGTIKCLECGLEMKGRVKMECASHPRILHYTDLQRCPKCKGTVEDVAKVTKKEVTSLDGNGTGTCICGRQNQIVFCVDCCWLKSGRKRQSCAVHPQEVYYTDLLVCPDCKGANLEEESEDM